MLVRPIRVNGFLQRYLGYMWYQYEISISEHRLVDTFQFGTTVRKKSKYLNMIDEKQCKELEKEGQKKGINISDTKEVMPVDRW